LFAVVCCISLLSYLAEPNYPYTRFSRIPPVSRIPAFWAEELRARKLDSLDAETSWQQSHVSRVSLGSMPMSGIR